jgi:hypothetical protein
MKLAYMALAYGIIALGIVHMAATFRFFDAASQAALWFFSGGLVIVLTGALNLLNREYGGVAPGLQRVCIATNVVMTVFALAAGLVGRASVTELCVIVGLFIGAIVLSASPRAMIGRSKSGAT